MAEDKKWVQEQMEIMLEMLKGTSFEIYYRNGHALSQYLKFKSDNYKHQIRVSNHSSKHYKTKFQLLKDGSKVGTTFRKDENC